VANESADVWIGANFVGFPSENDLGAKAWCVGGSGSITLMSSIRVTRI
jgi:hypothetical protein